MLNVCHLSSKMLSFMYLVSFYNRSLNVERRIASAVCAIAIHGYIMREMAGTIIGFVCDMDNSLFAGRYRLFVESSFGT